MAGFAVVTKPVGEGGPATKAQLTVAHRIAIGPDGSVYIPDRDNNRVRRVDAGGVIITVAGTNAPGLCRRRWSQPHRRSQK